MILILLFSRTTSYRLHWVLNTLEEECHSECIKDQDSKGNGTSRIGYKTTFKDSYFSYFCTLEIPKFRILSGVGPGKSRGDQLQFSFMSVQDQYFTQQDKMHRMMTMTQAKNQERRSKARGRK